MAGLNAVDTACTYKKYTFIITVSSGVWWVWNYNTVQIKVTLRLTITQSWRRVPFYTRRVWPLRSSNFFTPLTHEQRWVSPLWVQSSQIGRGGTRKFMEEENLDCLRYQ